MRNTSMILALALGLSALNTFAQNESAPGDRRDGPSPRHSESRPGQEKRWDNQDRPGDPGNRFEPRSDKRDNIRPRDGERGRIERMDSDRPAPRFRGPGGPGGPEGQFERGAAPRRAGRDMAFAPKHKGRFSPEWNFCPFCGHTLKPAMDQGGPGAGAGIRHEGPGMGADSRREGPGAPPAMGPGRRESDNAPRGEVPHRGPGNQGPGERRNQDDAGKRPDAPVHRPAPPADEAGR